MQAKRKHLGKNLRKRHRGIFDDTIYTFIHYRQHLELYPYINTSVMI